MLIKLAKSAINHGTKGGAKHSIQAKKFFHETLFQFIGTIGQRIMKNQDDIPKATHISFIIRNWDNLDCLNEKFNELKEKESNNTISEFEKSLLNDVLKKRILEFPNPYLPLDYKEAIEMNRKYGILNKAR